MVVACLAEAQQRLHQYAQLHLLKHLPKDNRAYLRSLLDLDLEFLNRLFKTSQIKNNTKPNDVTPFTNITHIDNLEAKIDSYNHGLQLIANGKVAALLLAGGSGTRLGSEAPKGCYNIGMPSNKSLFQYHAERVIAVRKLAAAHTGIPLENVRLPLLVMTSESNDSTTRQFFSSRSNFGIPESQLHFFQQGMLPAFSFDGKILRASEDELAMSPNGNGGVYLSLHESGLLSRLELEGVTSLFQFGVDNILCHVAEPTFVGFCSRQNAECGVKTIRKSHPHEKVGVLALCDGKPSVVEYSEITHEMAEATSPTGDLLYGSAHICVNWFSISFLRRFINEHLLPKLPFHIARKKVSHLLEDGSMHIPSEPNAIKFELFIFDTFPYASKVVALEVERDDEFAPVKNAPGSATDSPDTARSLFSALCTRQIIAAGGTISCAKDNASKNLLEIAPRLSYAGEGLENYRGREVQLPAHLE